MVEESKDSEGNPPRRFPLSYCAGGYETLARLENLYERRAADQVCAVFEVRTAALERFEQAHPAGFCDYPDPNERIAFWDEHLAERSALLDDSVPCAYLSEFDQGLYGGLLGGEVRFLSDPGMGWISSMVPPLFDELSDASKLTFDRDHPWFQCYLEQMDIFARGAAGKFGISHLILIDSVNFVFELIGATAAYQALIEQPEAVSRAIDFAFGFNVKIHEAFFDHVGLTEGGTCSNMIGWGPGRLVSESVDPFHMTSVDYFERWGREPIERIFNHFDGGVLHIHANGRHLLEAVSTLPGLKGIWLGDDRGYEPSFDILGELKRRVGDVPVIVSVNYDRFVRALDNHALIGGIQYVVTNTPDADAAHREMTRVRRYTF
ncbi:MAG: hypothetical protein AMS16_01645 [Planctomycetes bacterium DG_58]|nr:MAG: hypothetical protein AMS16_01645 [Planctomycetes bacterium DG_58]